MAKGYTTEDFVDAWERYPIAETAGDPTADTATAATADPPSADLFPRPKVANAKFGGSKTECYTPNQNSDLQSDTTQRGVWRNDAFGVEKGHFCDVSKNGTSLYGEKGCDVVTAGTPSICEGPNEEGDQEAAEIDRIALADGWDGSAPPADEGDDLEDEDDET